MTDIHDNRRYPDQDYEYDPGDEGGDCTMCGGEGYEECWDWIQCTRRHIGEGPDQMCPCSACDGTGLAKDQRIW